jgi:hypothetical protein
VGTRRAARIAAVLALLYLVIQAVYISRLPLVMDEFDGANEAYQLLHSTPYRDFRPYKTVLGYYVEVPPLLVTNDVWTGVMVSKLWLALINTAVIFAATLALASIFSPPAALLGTLLLISVTTFLERSSELRVDMLTACVGLVSLLLLLKRRWPAAGVAAGLSFLISQKGVYYCVAGSLTGDIFWLFESRDRKTFRDLVVMNAATLAVIAAYILLWGIVSTPSTVINATFFSSADIAFGELYNLEEHWVRTLVRNPLFYGGALAGIVWLVASRWRGRAGGTHLMAAVYGAAMFALCRWHKQPWPYFFVILIPTLMVVHAAAIDLIWRLPKWRTALVVVIALFGVAWPLMYMPGILERNHDYQRQVVRIAHAMLGDGDTYLAGNDLIYDHAQAHTQLRRLNNPRLEALKQWPPDRIDLLIADLERAHPKLMIDDIRMRMVPPRLRAYLLTRFDRSWPSISGYAPLVSSHEHEFQIWFDGDYRIEPEGGEAIVDGAARAAGTVISLKSGVHRNDSAVPVRLRLQPPPAANEAGRGFKGYALLYSRAYDY